MRVTNNMMTNNLMNNLNSVMRRLDTVNNQLSTQKRINAPSDDPIGALKAMRLHNEIFENNQYKSNIDSGKAWLNNTDVTLGRVVDTLNLISEKANAGANGTQSDESRSAIAKEVNEMLEELVRVANTQQDGKYIFGGQRTDVEPFKMDGSPPTEVKYNGDSNYIETETGVKIRIKLNVPGNAVFGDMFKSIIKLRDDLYEGRTQDISKQRIGEISDALDNVLQWDATVGAKSNRLALTSQKLADVNTNLKGLLSDTEDVDLPETIMELKKLEQVQQTALASGAKIIQPTLLDFLK